MASKEESLIYIKLERGEAMQVRRDILNSQVSLLKTLQKINDYGMFRTKNSELKAKFAKKIRELKTRLVNLEKALPRLKIQKTFKEKQDEKEREKSVGQKEPQSQTIESQLQEIQRRLEQLQGKSF